MQKNEYVKRSGKNHCGCCCKEVMIARLVATSAAEEIKMSLSLVSVLMAYSFCYLLLVGVLIFCFFFRVLFAVKDYCLVISCLAKACTVSS